MALRIASQQRWIGARLGRRLLKKGDEMEIDNLVIDRSRWLRGVSGEESLLLRPTDSKMCCLGFLGIACGIAASDISGMGEPIEVPSDKWPTWLQQTNDGYASDAKVVNRLIEINDDTGFTDADREADLRDVFAKHGVKVEFIDGEVDDAV
jgi:hypothetical protein